MKGRSNRVNGIRTFIIISCLLISTCGESTVTDNSGNNAVRAGTSISGQTETTHDAEQTVSVDIPDVTDMSEEDALKTLDILGITYEIEYIEPQTAEQNGMVAEQNVSGTVNIKESEKLVVGLIIYEKAAFIPQLEGENIDYAQKKLEEFGIEYEISEIFVKNDDLIGKVRTQSVQSGTKYEKNEKPVVLDVYAKKPYSIPDYYLTERIKSLEYWHQYDKLAFPAHKDTLSYNSDGLLTEIKSTLYDSNITMDINEPWNSFNGQKAVSSYKISVEYEGDVHSDDAVKVKILCDPGNNDHIFDSFSAVYEFDGTSLITREYEWISYEWDCETQDNSHRTLSVFPDLSRNDKTQDMLENTIKDGRLIKSRILHLNGKSYHFDSDGKLSVGWIRIGKNIYYADKQGIMLKGWNTVAKKKRYFDDTGKLLRNGIFNVDNSLYYFDEKGCYRTGWIKTVNGSYYADSSGILIKGWRMIGGKRYYFDDAA